MNAQEILTSHIFLGQINIDSIENETTQKEMTKGLESLKILGLPTRKSEDWKYTNILGFLEKNYRMEAPEDKINLSVIKNLIVSGHYLVFINGKLSIEDSVFPEGIEVTHHVSKKLNEPIEDIDFKDSLEMMNLIHLNNYTSVIVEKNRIIKEPLQLIHVYTDKSQLSQNSSRLHIHAKAGSNLTVMEAYVAMNTDLTNMVNTVTSCQVDSNALVEHIKLQSDSQTSLHLGTVKANVSRDGQFYSYTFATGGKIARNAVSINLNGENARGEAHGVFSIKGEQHNDNFITIHHNAPRTYSDQLFKGILNDKSHGVFTGKVKVNRGANLVESSQLNKNMILSNRALVDTQPQLEVYNDDVKCSHGATTGQISEEELFYLQSRGLTEDTAFKMLCTAFGEEVVYKLKNERLREVIGSVIKGSVIISLL